MIVNWNRPGDTERCLRSVVMSTHNGISLVVVDNGSNDRSQYVLAELVAELEARSYQAYLVTSTSNLGFAGGANLGIERALGIAADYVLLLNNDAVVTPDTIGALVRSARESHSAVIGPVVLDSGGATIRFAGRRWPHSIFGFSSSPASQGRSTWPTAYVDGSALMVRADVLSRRFDEMGFYMDPDLFMYWEDADLCLYAWSRGYRCEMTADAVVFHKVAASSGGPGNRRGLYYGTRNRITIANRWLSPIWRVLFHLYYVPSRIVLQLVRLGRVGPSATAAVASGIIDGYLGVRGRWSRHGEPVPEVADPA